MDTTISKLTEHNRTQLKPQDSGHREVPGGFCSPERSCGSFFVEKGEVMKQATQQVLIRPTDFPKVVRSGDTILDVMPTDNPKAFLLTTRKFPEIQHRYSKGFLERAIESGLLQSVE